MNENLDVNVIFFREAECPVCFSKLVGENYKLAWMEEVLTGASRERQTSCGDCGQGLKMTIMFNDKPNAVSYYRSKIRGKKNFKWGCSIFAPLI